jgi:bifunctional DNA-binding transcriptional regulator/antitoxin component of YhaV-PrlF toxin-antitoxin module
MIQTYTTTIVQDDQVNATGIPVPKEVIEAFNSGKRPRVIVTLNSFTYRTTVAAFGDVFMMPLSQERREAAGVKAGDTLEITLELDNEPRVVEVPADLTDALASVSGAREAFDRSSYSARKEFVRQVESAKAPETRVRRIQKIVDQLSR